MLKCMIMLTQILRRKLMQFCILSAAPIPHPNQKRQKQEQYTTNQTHTSEALIFVTRNICIWMIFISTTTIFIMTIVMVSLPCASYHYVQKNVVATNPFDYLVEKILFLYRFWRFYLLKSLFNYTNLF